MAKQKQQSENIRYAVNKKQLKQAREKAAQEREVLEKRASNREKSRRMGTVFLYGVLALIALFCLYTLVRTLAVRRAASLEELRGNLLFVSLAAIPFLLAAGAILVHRLLKNRRADYSDRARRLSNALFVLVLAAAFVLFGVQLRGGRESAADSPAYARTLAALEGSGLGFTAPEDPESVRTLLEHSQRTDLLCGRTVVRFHLHEGAGWIAQRFLDQAAWDYEDYPLTETGAVRRWGPVTDDELSVAALAARIGDSVRILELAGPAEELDTLLPLLTQALEPSASGS